MKIEIDDLGFSYTPGQPALDRVSLEIPSGELLAILGPSGSGKTTLLHLLAGFLEPARGSIRFGGRPVSGGGTLLPPKERDIGMVFQDLALWPHLSVRRHLDFVLRAGGVPRQQRKERSDELLGLLELDRLVGKVPTELSGGEGQRLALARALVARPRILLLDEPLGSLDRRLRDKALQLIENLHQRLETTTIYVTHDYREALFVASRVAVLQRGRLLQVSTPEDLYRSPATCTVAELCGPVTFLPAKPAGGGRVETPLGNFSAEFCGEPGAGATVVLRPEEVQIRVDPGGVGRVQAARFVGGCWEVDATVEGLGEILSGRSPTGILAGERVRLELQEPLRVLPGETR
jgi:ABC-type Fe3+/spermidine/putrescine transport system ATPase subunit